MIQCRMCLEEEKKPLLGLLSNYNNWLKPCQCKGTQAFIHKECLKLWFQHKNWPNWIKCKVCMNSIKNPMLELHENQSTRLIRISLRIILSYLIILFLSTIEITLEKLTSSPSLSFSNIIATVLQVFGIYGVRSILSQLQLRIDK